MKDKMRKLKILLISIILVLIGVLVGQYVFQRPEPPVETIVERSVLTDCSKERELIKRFVREDYIRLRTGL